MKGARATKPNVRCAMVRKMGNLHTIPKLIYHEMHSEVQVENELL